MAEEYAVVNEDTLGELLSSDSGISPELYQYYKGLNERRIIFNDAVSENIVERIAIPLMDMDNDGTGAPIEIIICTPGGSTFDSLVLCDIIDRLKTPTTIRAMGYMFSMGSLILMAGYNNPNVKRVCYPFTLGLVHAGSTYLEGAANIVKDTFNFTQRLERQIKEYVLSHSKISEEEYEKMERYEWYMLSEDMLRLGIVDEVL